MENTNREGHKLLFKDEEFRLDQVLSLAKSGPPIEVKLAELNMLGVKKLANAREEQPYVARHEPPLQEYREGMAVFFKQEGRFTVLFGHDKLALAIDAGHTVFKGKLISGPQLKKARIEKPISREELIEKLKASAPVEPQFNSPRITQERRPPQGERRGLPSQQARPPSAGARRYGSNETITRRDPKRS